MPPPSTMTTQPQATHPSLSASSSNPMDLSDLAAAIVDTPPPQPHRSLTAPTFTHTTSNSKLTSASRGKRKHSALGDDADLSQKCSCPPSATAKAHQEGSAALTTITQVFPQFLNSFSAPPSINQQDEYPPPTLLGSTITLLCTTQDLVDDDDWIVIAKLDWLQQEDWQQEDLEQEDWESPKTLRLSSNANLCFVTRRSRLARQDQELEDRGMRGRAVKDLEKKVCQLEVGRGKLQETLSQQKKTVATMKARTQLTGCMLWLASQHTPLAPGNSQAPDPVADNLRALVSMIHAHVDGIQPTLANKRLEGSNED
ncbi:hypothetical protein BD769DRAFT_1670808 [Suillus cothurnatus]|nr:hypothetical protein BD769DRAFT_1670808 [Suillus cothurnatus]